MLPDTSLLYFYEVAKAGSVRQAAEQLHISASAISRMVRKVEHRFRTPLFERRPSGMVLTAAGEVLARQLSGVAAQIRDAEQEIAELQGQRRGHVALHCIEAAVHELAPQFLSDVHRAHPGITYSVRTGSTDSIVAALLDYSADIGITYNLPELAGVAQIRTFRYPLYALVAPGHPLAGLPQASLRQIVDHRLALAEQSFGIRQVLNAALAQRQLQAGVVLTTNSLALLRGLVAHGDMVTLASRFAARSELASGRLVAVPLAQTDTLWGAVTICRRADRRLTATAQSLIDVMVQTFQASEDQAGTPQTGPAAG